MHYDFQFHNAHGHGGRRCSSFGWPVTIDRGGITATLDSIVDGEDLFPREEAAALRRLGRAPDFDASGSDRVPGLA